VPARIIALQAAEIVTVLSVKVYSISLPVAWLQQGMELHFLLFHFITVQK
jgi:hypothetical protein